ncbi:MAG: hypothetical protein R2912_10900 [Eubacteriales bacterium]
MNKTIMPVAQKEPRALLSTLWIAILINILSADSFSFYAWRIGGNACRGAPWIMFRFALVHELPIAMIVLSRVFEAKGEPDTELHRRGSYRLIHCGGRSCTHYIFCPYGANLPRFRRDSGEKLVKRRNAGIRTYDNKNSKLHSKTNYTNMKEEEIL